MNELMKNFIFCAVTVRFIKVSCAEKKSCLLLFLAEINNSELVGKMFLASIFTTKTFVLFDGFLL